MSEMQDNDRARLAILTAVVNCSRAKLGRTAVMKIMYFLQTVRNVPLGYCFRLYTYGPYDSQVLEDLRLAEAEKCIQVTSFGWQGGSGYEISPGSASDKILADESDVINRFEADLQWVIEEFACRSASDLEVASTIIYVDRENRQRERTVSEKELTAKVGAVKPHHKVEKIASEVVLLRKKGLLLAVM